MGNMEQAHSNKSDGMSRLENELKEKEEAIAKFRAEAKEYKNTLISCKEKLQESQKAIESNQRGIAYLNKQLNDNQMGNNMFGSNLTTPSPYSAQNLSRTKYTSPYLTKIGQKTTAMSTMTAPLSTSRDSNNNNMGISRLSGLGTAMSPILNNKNNENDRPTPPSSYFPQ